jgi:hypothetical protein
MFCSTPISPRLLRTLRRGESVFFWREGTRFCSRAPAREVIRAPATITVMEDPLVPKNGHAICADLLQRAPANRFKLLRILNRSRYKPVQTDNHYIFRYSV